MQTNYLKMKGFVPYLLIAFFNAFTDLGHKIIIQNAIFKFFDHPDQQFELRLYTHILQVMVLLPFILIFTPSGFLSDKFPKNQIIRISAFASIPITIGITVCYFIGAFWWAFILTFILALQSAIYSPAKYGYVKEIVGPQNLTFGNSALQAITIIAILGGTIGYTLLFEYFIVDHFESLEEILQSIPIIGFFLIGGSVIETFLSYQLPTLKQKNTKLQFNFKKYVTSQYLIKNLQTACSHEGIRLSILGLGIFWAINQVLLATFGAHLKDILGISDTRIANGLMALGGIGIILGAISAAKMSKNYIETGMVPLGGLGVAFCLFILPSVESVWTLGVLFTIYGIFGGLFLVPLNALIQYYSKDEELGQILAANNFIQTIMMLLFLGISIFLTYLSFSNKETIYILSIVTFLVTVYSLIKLPQSFIRYLIAGLVSSRYKIQVVNMENLPSQGGVLLLGNHISWLDWAILQIASPRPIRFVMLRSIYEKWYIKWFLNYFRVIPITRGASAKALESVNHALNQEEVVAIFPEGHISQTGHLSIFRTGFERAIKNTNSVIVPFYLRGLWGTAYSYATGKYKKVSVYGRHRKITVGFGKPISSSSKASDVKQAVAEISIHTWKEYIKTLYPIAQSWLYISKKYKNQISVIEKDGSTYTYQKLFVITATLSKEFKKYVTKEQNIGILFPPSLGGIIANMMTLLLGKTIVNLNYTATLDNLFLAIEKAEIKIVLTSKLVLKKLAQRGMELNNLEKKVTLIFLEDFKKKISKFHFLKNVLLFKYLPFFITNKLLTTAVELEDTACILFSSGSEATPKGVELTHMNILGNIKQISMLMNTKEEDVMLSSLPLFHAFGLTVTTFLPLLEAIPLVCEPDPTDVKSIGYSVAKYQISILFGTSTFLRMYTKSNKILPLMFQSLRLVISGAEKLQQEVKTNFKLKFGKDIYEGYGTTETTPVASVNIPDTLLSFSGPVQVGNKPGTVGLALPGSMVRIVDPDTLEELPTGEAGLILIGGIQIMKGYLKDPIKTKAVIFNKDHIQWYKSGDQGKIDEDGFIQIVDRYSRFAKIGGEMISLSAVEENIRTIIASDEIEIISVAMPDATKGEKIVVAFSGEIHLDDVRKKILESKLSPLMKPKEFFHIPNIPKLGSGKLDVITVKKMLIQNNQSK